jgi:hypothetical protein
MIFPQSPKFGLPLFYSQGASLNRSAECSTRRFASISAIISPASCVRLRPMQRSAKASASARFGARKDAASQQRLDDDHCGEVQEKGHGDADASSGGAIRQWPTTISKQVHVHDAAVARAAGFGRLHDVSGVFQSAHSPR